MAKPSLHEIAAMPYPASMLAMREHYIPNWGKPDDEGGELRAYKVEVSYSYRVSDSRTYEVEANCLAEAEALAEAAFDTDRSVESEADVDEVVATQVGDA